MIEYLGHKFFKQNSWTDESWDTQYMICCQCKLRILREGYTLCYSKANGYIDMTYELDITCDEYIIKKMLE